MRWAVPGTEEDADRFNLPRLSVACKGHLLSVFTQLVARAADDKELTDNIDNRLEEEITRVLEHHYGDSPAPQQGPESSSHAGLGQDGQKAGGIAADCQGPEAD
jgi:hypothetical protein